MDGLGRKGSNIMYYYVKDKDYLKRTYSTCSDIVNQLVQHLKKYGIESRMSLVGSGGRNMVTQNEKEAIDFDFNLEIIELEKLHIRDYRQLKETVRKAFNEVLKKNGWGDCQDSTSALTTEQRVLKKGNKTPFSIDVCIIWIDSCDRVNRLIHQKTGIAWMDQYFWNEARNAQKIWEREYYIKDNDCWSEVRRVYLEKKNRYLTRNDYEKSSFICFIEAVNEVYFRICV